MENIKEEYASSVKQISDVFVERIKDKSIHSDIDPYLSLIGINSSDVEMFYRKISRALPDKIIMQGIGAEEDTVKHEIIKKFILFMAQENISKKNFDNNFANLIYEIINDVGNNKIYNNK